MISVVVGLAEGANQRRDDELAKLRTENRLLRDWVWERIKAYTHPAVDRDPAIDAAIRVVEAASASPGEKP